MAEKDGVSISGFVSIGVFYLLILGVGLWAAAKKRKKVEDTGSGGAADVNVDEQGKETAGVAGALGAADDLMLAGRNIGVLVGIFTMTATWVGGGYINGTAEVIYTSGLAWCQAPIGYSLSLAIGGLLFAKKMRKKRYVTMLDPLQERFGQRMGGLLFIPALLGELFWSAAILSALGSTLQVIGKIGNTEAILISAAIAVIYTMFGGLYSVAYTDVIQLACIFVGLWLCIPFSMINPAVASISTNFAGVWDGAVKPSMISHYIDNMVMLIFGGIPWQVYFQRVLSSKTEKTALLLSFVGAIGCIVMAIPAVLIGAVAKNTDWNATVFSGEYLDDDKLTTEHHKIVLPLVLRYLCPEWVAFIGLGSISAAVMSSADSSILSASSMMARNVIKAIFWQAASDRQIIWTMRIGVVIVGGIACLIGILIKSVYGLWFLSSDLIFVVLFPQLLGVVHMPRVNIYGSVAGYVVGAFVRLSAGEPVLRLPALIRYPGYTQLSSDDPLNYLQTFPIRIFAMALSLTAFVGVSLLTDWLFRNEIVNAKFDVLKMLERGEPLPKLSISTRNLRRSASKMLKMTKVVRTNEDVR